MVRFSEREYAALNRRASRSTKREPEPEPVSRRVATPMSWRCRTLIPEPFGAGHPCGEVVESEAAMRRHLPVHGVGATFECVEEPQAEGR